MCILSLQILISVILLQGAYQETLGGVYDFRQHEEYGAVNALKCEELQPPFVL